MPNRLRISGPYIPYGLFQTKGETCAKFGSDLFRNVNLYKFHTYKQTNIHSSLYIRFGDFLDFSQNPLSGAVKIFLETAVP
jgi:hypothetical protein